MDDPKFSVPSNLPVAPATAPKTDTSFRSSIRTMESDIKSAQTGQAPKAFEVKPPLFSATPNPAQPLVPPKTPSPTPVVPPTGIKLGEAEKRTAPLPGQVKPIPPKPESNPPTSGPEAKVAPAIPVVPVTPPPAPPVLPKQASPTPPVKISPPLPPPGGSKGGVFVPPKPSIFGSRKVVMVAVIAVLVVLGGILYLRFGQPSEEVSGPTPTPIVPEATLSVSSITTLAGIFGQSEALSFLDTDREYFTASFKSDTISLSNNKTDKNILVTVKNQSKNGANFNFSDFLNHFSIGFPANLISYWQDNDFNLILTKQTEFFDQNGKLIANPSAEMLLTPKVALTVRVIDSIEAKNQLTLWEDTMSADLGRFYDYQVFDSLFSDNMYQGVSIRFVNFPYADKAIDYAIVTAKNGNDYLVIANSREQIYSIIDKLLGF